MNNILLVMLGGSIGAGLRFLASQALSFPYAIPIINIVGSFLIGLLAFSVTHESLRIFLMAGILGGFTTFSAFSLETLTLWQRGEATSATLYIAVSVIGSLLAVWLGFKAAQL